MKKVFQIHGFKGSPNGSWHPWLMSELKKQDIYACALPMPSPDHPYIDKWVKTITTAIEGPYKDTFLVGHSLGVPTILRYLETLPSDLKLGGAVLVSGPFHNLRDNAHKELDPFFENSFNFEYIKKVCNKFIVIHAIDDTRVPISHAVLLANKLGCEVITLPTGGHLTGSEGVYKLPQVLAELEKMLKE